MYQAGKPVGKVERVEGSLVVYREFVHEPDPACDGPRTYSGLCASRLRRLPIFHR